METQNFLAKNLRDIQNALKKSLTEYAEALDISKSTLREIMQNGNTTLDTVIRIASGLHIGLDRLVFDEELSDKLFILKYLTEQCEWLAGFPEEKQQVIAKHIAAIWLAISEEL